MNTRKFFVALGGGILTLLLIFGFAFLLIKGKPSPAKQAPQRIIRKVNSAIVGYNTVESKINSTGRVISQQSVDIIAEVQGKLLPGDITLKPGQNFSQGQVLVRIYSKDSEYALQARKSGYLNLLANILPDLKIDYADAYSDWVKYFESVRIAEDLPELPEVNSAQLKIFLASRNILSEYYAIKSDETRLRKYVIRAPYSGAIQSVLLEVGSVANPGSRIAQIIKTTELEVEVPLEPTSAAWLRIGDKVKLYTENGKGEGSGRIKRISSFVDENTQSINVYLTVDNFTPELFPGEYLKVEFSGLQIANAMEIPRNAVFNRNMVYIVNEGLLHKSQINLLKINEQTIIFNGLEEGAEIVTEPLVTVGEDMQVQTNFTKPSPEADTLSAQKMQQPE